MTDKPILFSSSMVGAIIDGQKTQTRRLIKPQPEHGSDAGRCPYSADLLWVKETFAVGYKFDKQRTTHLRGAPVWYREDLERDPEEESVNRGRWRPSIFMPRWASRITLEVIGLRAERLQDISPEDSVEEGIVERAGTDVPIYSAPGLEWRLDPRDAYQHLWQTINLKRAPWSSNPWVWVVEFRRAKTNEAISNAN